jgi:hypothetical protein
MLAHRGGKSGPNSWQSKGNRWAHFAATGD